jgi:hypothetical protein
MTFAQAETGSTSLAQALLQPNSGAAINEYEVAYPAAGGGARPGFPATRQGIDFLGEPIVTDVTGDGQGSVVDGGDSNAVHAYTSTGGMAAGFPKWMPGWTLFSPAAGDLLGTGKTDLVSLTREGYLFLWSTPGSASANTEWWRGQHDEWNSGNYEAQTRPPGAIRGAHRSGDRVTFVAPGSLWYLGTPSSYLVTFEASGRTMRVAASVPAGVVQTIVVPTGTGRLEIQAVGPTGLLGRATWLG